MPTEAEENSARNNRTLERLSFPVRNFVGLFFDRYLKI